MASLLDRFFRRGIESAVRNEFNRAFFATVGTDYTAYDENADTYLEQGYLYNPTVYSVVNARATKAASIPFEVKRVQDKNAKRAIDRLNLSTKHILSPNQLVKKRILETKAFNEEVLDFPMERPNALQTWADIISLYETFMSVTGNFYLYCLKGDFATEPLQVYVLPSHLMQIVLKPEASMLGMESPIAEYMLIEGNTFATFDAEEVIHIKTPNPEYGLNGEHLYGLSPLRAALRNIQSSNVALDNSIKTLNNSGAFGFIHGKNQALLEPQAKELKERLIEMDASSERLGKIAGVSAEVGFTRLALTTDELKPFDYLGFDEKQICNVLGWDNKLLNNNDGAKYDNYKTAERRVVSSTTIPSLTLLEQAMTDRFLPAFKGYEGAIFQFDYSELPEMQQDLGEMVKWLSVAKKDGAINLNEYREAMQYPRSDDPNMDIHTVEQDVIPLEEALFNDFGQPTAI